MTSDKKEKKLFFFITPKFCSTAGKDKKTIYGKLLTFNKDNPAPDSASRIFFNSNLLLMKLNNMESPIIPRDSFTNKKFGSLNSMFSSKNIV